MKILSVLIILIGLLLTACEPSQQTPAQEDKQAPKPDADSIYLNGRIYTVNENQDWVEAVAILDGKFIRVGTNSEINTLIGDNTRVIDLENKLVMPGLYDSHIHPIGGMVQELYQCNFPFTGTLEDAVVAVKKCADDHPDWQWISGGQWNASVLDTTMPGKEMLDAAIPDRPVYLIDATYHHGWVNTKALELAGITKETDDPPGGTIVRDEKTGEAVGTLLETAKGLVADTIPKFTSEQYINATRSIQERMNAFGFIGMKSASTPREHLQALSTLAKEDRLTIRVGTHLSYIHTAANPDRAAKLEEIIRDRGKYSNRLLRTDFIKVMLDGVPPSHTAAYLEPYADKPDYFGDVLVPQDELNAATIRFDAMGMTVKYHAVGDRAARVAVNAIEAARQANGLSGLLHEIGHASLMHPDDVTRLAKLGGIAEVSPILWYPSPFIVRAHRPMLGEERYEKLWPIKSYIDSGVITVAGSDWPAAVASPNPWPAIEAMVTRKNPYGEMPGEIRGEEYAVDLATAIRIYTQNGALAMGIADSAGSIEVGKSADMIALDQNLFEIPADDISETNIELTVIEGNLVYERE